MQFKHMILAASALLAPAAALAQESGAIPGVKNVIVIINDGAGPTVYDATRLYLGHGLVTDGAGFHSTYVSTYPLREDGLPNSVYSTDPHFSPTGVLLNNNQPITNAQQAAVIYDTARFWDTTPVAGASRATGYGAYPAGFAGYEWSRFAHPDSGNTASSIATGTKSYNNAINVDGVGTPQVAITDIIDAARRVGKTTGVVSTVQFADATPAALGGAHNIARANRTAIAAEMFSSGKLDVIGGTGNPDYDDNGNPRVANYSWISQPHWQDLRNKTNLSGLNALRWPLLQQKAEVEALANRVAKPPRRVAMIIRGDNSSQYNRAGVSTNPTLHEVYDPARNLPNCVTNGVAVAAGVACQQPPQPNVPTLGSMTVAALNVLGSQGRGFYLMAEEGSVDRAEHGNSTARMIEEMIESNNTVQSVIDWVNRPDTAATWDNTLLIVTADHDHLLYGPDGATVPFQPLQDRGAGNTPGNRWFGPNHGTGLVPLFAYGKGAESIVALANKTDNPGVTLTNPADGQSYTLGHGAYLDQTDLGVVLKATLGQAN